LAQRLLEFVQLGGIQFGRPAGARGFAQSGLTGLFQLSRPAANRLPMHSQLSRHLGLAKTLAE
jgi:hypothetical protein